MSERDNVGWYRLRAFSHPVALCCVLFRVFTCCYELLGEVLISEALIVSMEIGTGLVLSPNVAGSCGIRLNTTDNTIEYLRNIVNVGPIMLKIRPHVYTQHKDCYVSVN